MSTGKSWESCWFVAVDWSYFYHCFSKLRTAFFSSCFRFISISQAASCSHHRCVSSNAFTVSTSADQLWRNFIFLLTKCTRSWSLKSLLQQQHSTILLSVDAFSFFSDVLLWRLYFLSSISAIFCSWCCCCCCQWCLYEASSASWFSLFSKHRYRRRKVAIHTRLRQPRASLAS